MSRYILKSVNALQTLMQALKIFCNLLVFVLRNISYFSPKSYFMSTTRYIKPTESELEILQVLWARETASVRDVHEELAKSKDVGYTTTLKLMQIMNEKGLVKRDDSFKTHIYQPAVSKEKTQKHLLGKMINSLFGGSHTELIIQALGNHKASPQELEAIQHLLDNLKKQ
jgi:BlaI family transcriptional regulator, penicillinase repressor